MMLSSTNRSFGAERYTAASLSKQASKRVPCLTPVSWCSSGIGRRSSGIGRRSLVVNASESSGSDGSGGGFSVSTTDTSTSNVCLPNSFEGGSSSSSLLQQQQQRQKSYDITSGSDVTPFQVTAAESKRLPGADGSGGARQKDRGDGEDTWKAVASYQLQRVLLGDLWTKMAAYFGLGIPAIAVGVVSIYIASGLTEDFMSGVLKIYGSLYKVPGVNVLNAGPPLEDFVLNIVWFFGTFFFGIMLGVLNEEIGNLVKGLRSGGYDLPLTRHTLVVGWNPLLIPLVKQVAMAQQEREGANLSGTLVIVADEPQALMDASLRAALRDFPKLQWYARSGQPMSLRDLQRCSAARAETVFLLRPPGAQFGADSTDQELAAVLTLAAARSAAGEKLTEQRMVVQLPEGLAPEDKLRWDSARAVAAAPGGGVECSVVEGVTGLTRLMAQSAVQPGVASMVSQMLQHSYQGAEFYSRPFTLSKPAPFSVVRRMYTAAVLVGYVTSSDADTPNGTSSSSNGTGSNGSDSPSSAGLSSQPGRTLKVNPSDDDIVQPGDELLALAQSLADFVPSPGAAAEAMAEANAWEQRRQQQQQQQSGADGVLPGVSGVASGPTSGPAQPQTIGVLSLDPFPLARAVSHLVRYAPPGSTIIGICEAEGPTESAMPSGEELAAAGLRYVHVQARPTDVGMLLRKGVPAWNSLVLLGSQGKEQTVGAPSRMHDAVVQSMFLSLQSAVQRAPPGMRAPGAGPLHAVASVQHTETIEVIAGALQSLPPGSLTSEFIKPTRMLAGWLVHMAVGPAIGALLRLLVEEGSLIDLAPASSYLPEAVANGQPVRLGEAAEVARVQGCTALGFVTSTGLVRLAGFGPDDAQPLQPGDQIVLLTGGCRSVRLE